MSNPNPPYKYRPVSEDPEEVHDLLMRWLGAAVEFGYDVGTRKKPLPKEQWKRDPAELKQVLETLGLLPSDAVPQAPEVQITTQPGNTGACGHKKCSVCRRCACDDVAISTRKKETEPYCSECRLTGSFIAKFNDKNT